MSTLPPSPQVIPLAKSRATRLDDDEECVVHAVRSGAREKRIPKIDPVDGFYMIRFRRTCACSRPFFFSFLKNGPRDLYEDPWTVQLNPRCDTYRSEGKESVFSPAKIAFPNRKLNEKTGVVFQPVKLISGKSRKYTSTVQCTVVENSIRKI